MPIDPLNRLWPLGTLSAELPSLHSSTQSLGVKPAAQGPAQCCLPWLPRPCDHGPGVGGQVQVPASLLNSVRPSRLWGATPQHQERGGLILSRPPGILAREQAPGRTVTHPHPQTAPHSAQAPGS